VITGYTHPYALVDTAWVVEHLHDPNVRIVEVDVNRQAYDGGHIPGAILWVVYEDLLDPYWRLKDDPADVAALLARSGIAADTTVVFYSGATNANMPATFGYWLLASFGHGGARIMNGGRKKWLAERRPLELDPPAVAPTSPQLAAPDWQHRARRDLVEASLGRDDVALVDVRNNREYAGELFSPGAPPKPGERAGHIPGAVHLPYESALNDDGTFKPADELCRLYAEAGVTPDKRAIPYCTVGGRSSFTWFVLSRLLGYPDVRLYEASWGEWGRLPDTPVDR
jgi:thiosulfate/3-mercaptopyruvate sulfurtransferase